MRRFVVGMALGAILIVSTTSATAATSGSATLTGPGNAPSRFTGASLTELEFRANECQGTPALHGSEAWIINLSGTNTFKLTSSARSIGDLGAGTAPYELNVRFLMSNCVYNNLPSKQTTGSTFGPVYTYGSKWAIVSLQYGTNVRINWEAYVI